MDGPRQKNSDRSEGPWGRAAEAVRTEVLQRATSPGTERGSDEGSGKHEGRGKLIDAMVVSHGKALSDQPTLKPYWGKPAVRNFREGNGNVGIMRSPLRAIALPDQSPDAALRFLTTSAVNRRVASSNLARGAQSSSLISGPYVETDSRSLWVQLRATSMSWRQNCRFDPLVNSRKQCVWNSPHATGQITDCAQASVEEPTLIFSMTWKTTEH